MKIHSISKSLTFGHELDDKLSEARRKWNNAYEKAADYRKRVENEKTDFQHKDKDLDTKIEQAKDKEQKGLISIEEKQALIKNLETGIENKQHIANNILDEINFNSQQIQEANNKHNLSLESFISLKNETINNHTARLAEANSNYQNEYNNIINGIKAKLIKILINPVNTRFEDNPSAITSTVFISDVLQENNIDTQSCYEKILSWVVNMTDSNYGVIDSKDYQDKPLDTFFHNLKTILFVSNKLHESNGSYSITLISNLQNIIDKFSPKEDNVFSEITNKSSELFHNSFIIIAKQSEKLEKLLSKGLKLDNFFVNDSKFGIKSLTHMIENNKTAGINLQQFLK